MTAEYFNTQRFRRRVGQASIAAALAIGWGLGGYLWAPVNTTPAVRVVARRPQQVTFNGVSHVACLGVTVAQDQDYARYAERPTFLVVWIDPDGTRHEAHGVLSVEVTDLSAEQGQTLCP